MGNNKIIILYVFAYTVYMSTYYLIFIIITKKLHLLVIFIVGDYMIVSVSLLFFLFLELIAHYSEMYFHLYILVIIIIV